MARYRNALPQLDGSFFLADAGLETDLIFNRGIEIREFAAHTLLPDPVGRDALADYFRAFLSLAGEQNAGFILDGQTWKAHRHWAEDLGATPAELRQANQASIQFIAGLRDEFPNNPPIVLCGIVGPRGDAYAPEAMHAADEARAYHSEQLGWLAETDVDMVSGTTFTQSAEAAGFVMAAADLGLPAAISFTVETDGCLPTGQALGDAIREVDDSTAGAAAYFGVNCAHPDHFLGVLDGNADWASRIRALRCNASRQSHAELDACEVLDDGDPRELADQYGQLLGRLPGVNVFGGCCGTDIRHVKQIAGRVRGA